MAREEGGSAMIGAEAESPKRVLPDVLPARENPV